MRRRTVTFDRFVDSIIELIYENSDEVEAKSEDVGHARSLGPASIAPYISFVTRLVEQATVAAVDIAGRTSRSDLRCWRWVWPPMTHYHGEVGRRLAALRRICGGDPAGAVLPTAQEVKDVFYSLGSAAGYDISEFQQYHSFCEGQRTSRTATEHAHYPRGHTRTLCVGAPNYASQATCRDRRIDWLIASRLLHAGAKYRELRRAHGLGTVSELLLSFTGVSELLLSFTGCHALLYNTTTHQNWLSFTVAVPSCE